jgi:hypothetical protein
MIQKLKEWFYPPEDLSFEELSAQLRRDDVNGDTATFLFYERYFGIPKRGIVDTVAAFLFLVAVAPYTGYCYLFYMMLSGFKVCKIMAYLYRHSAGWNTIHGINCLFIGPLLWSYVMNSVVMLFNRF